MVKHFKFLVTLVLFLSSFAHGKSNNSDIILSAPDEKFFHDERKPSAYIIFAKEIAAAENYLNSFNTLTATFKQSNKEGAIRYGKLFISKPEKIRCEYLPPSPLLLILKTNKLVLYDYDLDEVSYASSDINSLKILALQDFQFKNVNLVEVEREGDFIDFTIKEKIKSSDQILLLTMKFSYPNIALKQINILSEESDIDLILSSIKYNQTLGKELFSFNRDILRKNK